MHVEIRDAILIKSPQCLALFMHGCILVLLASRLVSSRLLVLFFCIEPRPFLPVRLVELQSVCSHLEIIWAIISAFVNDQNIAAFLGKC